MVLLSLVTAFSVNAYALEPWPGDCYVSSEGACLMDADSKTVLFGQNENTAYYPASITKVLTALITLENCDNLSEQVTFSYDAVHIEEENSTIIGASEGDKLSVLDCLYSLLFQSANEVANALAEHVGAKHPELKEQGMSDRDVFVRMMNDKAAELGCRGSHFNNPSGLTDDEHYTTAYDMCLIMAAAVKNEQFLDIERHTYWTHAPIKRYPDADDPWNTVYAKHLMLRKNSSQYYEGTIAGKTGYTMHAGNTLVTAVKRDGMTLVTCVLNGHATHYNDTIRLMDFGFDSFTSVNVNDYDDINDAVRNDFSLNGIALIGGYTLGTDDDVRVTIPKSGSFAEVEKELVIEGEDQGKPSSAKMVYTYGDRTVGSADLKLISIDESEEILARAESDPLLRSKLGIADEEETEDGAVQTESAAGEEASVNEGTAENAVSEEDAALVSDTEDSGTLQAEPADDASEGVTVPASDAAQESLQEASEAGESNASESAGASGIALRIAAVITVIAAAAAALIYLRKKSEARKRAERLKRRHNNGRYYTPRAKDNINTEGRDRSGSSRRKTKRY